MGSGTFLTEITNSNAAWGDNNQKCHLLPTYIQTPERSLEIFIYFPGRQRGNRMGISAGLQRKILLNMGWEGGSL